LIFVSGHWPTLSERSGPTFFFKVTLGRSGFGDRLATIRTPNACRWF
jgi:hypothetical protein